MKLARTTFALSLVAVGCAAVAGLDPLAFDASQPDGAVTDSDAEAPRDAGADRFVPIGCAADPGHDFCDDFTQPIVFGDAGWTANPSSGSATLIRDTESVLVSLPVTDSGVEISNFLELVRPWIKRASGLRPRFVLRARMFVEQCPLGVTFLRYFRGNENYSGVLQLHADRGECYSQLIWVDNRDAGGQGYLHLFERTAVGAWHEMALEIEEVANGATTITYEIDGRRSGATVEATNSVDEVVFRLGLQGMPSGGRVRFDDVRVDWTAR
jgi:hypothetical protein